MSGSSDSVDSYIGSSVSIEMSGGMGYFQGVVIHIDNNAQQIKLTDVIHDGRPTKVKEMLFSAQHIKGLEVLSGAKKKVTRTQSAAGVTTGTSSSSTSTSAIASEPPAGASASSSSIHQKDSTATNQKMSPVDNICKGLQQQSLDMIVTPNSSISAAPHSKTAQHATSEVVQPSTTEAIHRFLSQNKPEMAQPELIKNSLSSTKSLPVPEYTNNKDITSELLSLHTNNARKPAKKTETKEPTNNGGNKKKNRPRTPTIDTISKNNRQHQLVSKSSSVQNVNSKGDSYGSPYHSRYGAGNGYTGNNGEGYSGNGNNGGGYGGYNGGGYKSNKFIGQQKKNNNTFGNEIFNTDMNEDFDFESNNKLFDKRAVAAEIDQLKLEHHQPDVVSQTEHHNQNRNKSNPNQQQAMAVAPELQPLYQPEPKYRHDQNVLAPAAQADRRITLPADETIEVMYSTESALLVPSVSSKLRQSLLSCATQLGFTLTRQHEVTARSAAELCIQLLGGEHRLNAKNSHQMPRVVLLCGHHQQGSLGLNTARQLLTQDLITTVITPTTTAPPLHYSNELKLYTLSKGGVVVHSTAALDSASTTIDLILDARLDHKGTPGGESGSCSEWLADVTAWAARQRCPVLALDPPSHQLAALAPLPARALLVPVLPLVYSQDQGMVHLVKLAIPDQVYQDLGITYASPFHSKFMVTLHPLD